MLPRNINRQNSSPQLSRPRMKGKTPAAAGRSKTPPPKFATPLVPAAGSDEPPRSFTLPRNPSKKRTSSPERSTSTSSKSTSASSKYCIKEVTMDTKYNLYCQANLIALHSKSVRERNENKMIQEMVKLETNLLDMDEKMSALDTNLEKKQFYEKARFNLQEEIRSYERIINEIDEDKLDEYIRVLEQDLGNVQLKNFDLPKSEEEAKEILESLQEIDKNLDQISEVEKKVLPFTQLHSSWLEVKRNVQKEKELESTCEKDLKLAEKLVYDLCFEKSVEFQNISKAA
ncbi:uncharacterized protein LOC135841752 [Planococcus citri]|uniref:uncharacterized protein LOC135841752 n=1 Tax=Planococcus citri TaxID=170843 RepID=UPI0031F73DDD